MQFLAADGPVRCLLKQRAGERLRSDSSRRLTIDAPDDASSSSTFELVNPTGKAGWVQYSAPLLFRSANGRFVGIEAGDSDRLQEVIQIVHRTGALDVARDAAGAEAARAVTAAKQLPPGPHANCLIELATALLQRQS